MSEGGRAVEVGRKVHAERLVVRFIRTKIKQGTWPLGSGFLSSKTQCASSICRGRPKAPHDKHQ